MVKAQQNPQQDSDAAGVELERQRTGLISKLEKSLERQKGKLRKLSTALTECDNEEKYRRFGELLKANLSSLRRGADRVKVVDYYSENQSDIVIEVAPEKTPLENMEIYFKRARKLRNGRPRIEREMENTRKAISRLEEFHSSVAGVDDLKSLEALAADVAKALASKRPRKIKGKPQAKLGPKIFVSSEGFEILVGRNQKQNDRLTLTIARGSDLFMHASGSPGSHVIIRTGGKADVPRKTMFEAANLAAYHSKQRNSRFVEVSWTAVKNVSKPRHAKPGLVYLSKHKVLAIEPDEELVKMLHENAREL